MGWDEKGWDWTGRDGMGRDGIPGGIDADVDEGYNMEVGGLQRKSGIRREQGVLRAGRVRVVVSSLMLGGFGGMRYGIGHGTKTFGNLDVEGWKISLWNGSSRMETARVQK